MNEDFTHFIFYKQELIKNKKYTQINSFFLKKKEEKRRWKKFKHKLNYLINKYSAIRCKKSH